MKNQKTAVARVAKTSPVSNLPKDVRDWLEKSCAARGISPAAATVDALREAMCADQDCQPPYNADKVETVAFWEGFDSNAEYLEYSRASNSFYLNSTRAPVRSLTIREAFAWFAQRSTSGDSLGDWTENKWSLETFFGQVIMELRSAEARR